MSGECHEGAGWTLPGILAAGVLLQGLYFPWQFGIVSVILAMHCALTYSAGEGILSHRFGRLATVWVLAHAITLFWAVDPSAAVLVTARALGCALVFDLWHRASGRVSPKRLLAAPIMVAGTAAGLLGLLAMDGFVGIPGATLQGRLSSVFQYANAAGAVMAATFIISLGVWIDSDTRSANRPLALITSGTALLCLIHTLSRGAWISLLAGMLAWILVCLLSGTKEANWLKETLTFLSLNLLYVVVSFAADRLVWSSHAAGSHVFAAIAGMGISVAFWFLTTPRACAKSHTRRHLALGLALLLVAFCRWGAPADKGATSLVPYTAKPGDTLTQIGNRLPSPISGTEIYAANEDRIADPQHLEPGTVLLIPTGQDGFERAAVILRTVSLETPTFGYRVLAWRDAISLLKQKPWGLGGGGWEAMYKTYQTSPYLTGDIHSALLGMALDSGLLGLFFFISLILVVGYRYVRMLGKKEASLWGSISIVTAAVLLMQGSVDATFHFTGIAFVFWACLGVAAGEPRPFRTDFAGVQDVVSER